MGKDNTLFAVIVILAVALAGESWYVVSLRRHHAPVPAARIRVQIPPVPVPLIAGEEADESSWDPLQEMERIQRQMNRMFKESIEKGARDSDVSITGEKGFFEPEMDLRENEHSYIVRMDLPGMRKDEIKVGLRGGLLTVSGQRRQESDEKGKGGLVRQERSYGYFSRTVTLPDNIKPDSAKADYRDGELVVSIQKQEGAGQADQGIEIKVE